jgi:adenylosuccinate lyase
MMDHHPIHNISPVDGRYAEKTRELSGYFSEYALIKARVLVEIQYFIALVKLNIKGLDTFHSDKIASISAIYDGFTESDALRIKEIEKKTNHDVKAVEYFLKEKFADLGLSAFSEFIHFGLTSQDINNTAVPLLLRDYIQNEYFSLLDSLSDDMINMAEQWKDVPMLARTHGQPASPTMLGKEIMVFVERLHKQMGLMYIIPFSAKFGGATGNFNAHYAAYPQVDWIAFADAFVNHVLELERSRTTTQIEHYDNLAALCHNAIRINTILIDFCRDMWTYISMEYFRQKTVKDEVGSSAMPHKVNPIDFENAEGNLGIASTVFEHLAAKLPVSRLQRDLTDSTVLRNIGLPFAHTHIAFQAIRKGLSRIVLNAARLHADLENNWMVIAEAIQTILRREGYEKPYEALKEMTRGKEGIGKKEIHAFIDTLNVSDKVKKELKGLTPHNYTGKYPQ